MKYCFVVSAVLVLLIALFSTAAVYADISPEETPETAGIEVLTYVSGTGDYIRGDELSWRLSSEVLDINLEDSPEGVRPFAEPPLNPGRETQMTTGYSEITLGSQGEYTQIKNLRIDTGSKIRNEYNLDVAKELYFESAVAAGRMTSSEDILIDLVSTPQPVEFGMICPCHEALGNCTPPFCSVTMVTSDIDVSKVSLASEAQSRAVGAAGDPGFWPPVPVIDVPVALNYRISAGADAGNYPALGSVETTLSHHGYEGAQFCPGLSKLGQELWYEETYSAEGAIFTFVKDIQYESGLFRS